MEFVAIDVETANADMASICQIGLVKYKDGELQKEWSSLINPEDYFDFINVGIHGITEESVANSPVLSEVYDILVEFMSDEICVCHTHFDRVSLFRAFEQSSLKHFNITWLDSARVARRAWEECAWSGYGLANVCKIIGYEFQHHDALEDAKASGQVILAALNKTGMDIESWLSRVNKPIDLNAPTICRKGNPEGELFGEVLAFTGALMVPRAEASELASSIGCEVGSGVTKKTTILVVGDQDITKLAGKSKSSKHIKAETLISKGQKIRVLKESDFVELVNMSQNNA
ncbi:exonuclease domain-containing protein [Pseudoalteromonas sp. RB2-MNA-CIBAN-0110]|uniref:exonuclease domain-containing protein n=1 Tax=Pseudoalteromonas sp. RB2-MNA-CIBAN-0110 TaxID=3140439 RepID=UPI0033290AA9